MPITLSKKPTDVTIVEGFPGFGLVGSIAIEYLLEHLECELIGTHLFEDLAATLTIHGGKILYPLSIYHNKKYNLVIVHSIITTTGVEWKLQSLIEDIAKQTKAKEIISLEGVGSTQPLQQPKTFYYTQDKKRAKKLDSLASPLNEGIIIGVTSALLLKTQNVPVTALFADTASQLPDSKAAAKLIELLHGYLGIDVDTKPLLEMAKKFEAKLKGILAQGAAVQEDAKKKQLSYVG